MAKFTNQIVSNFARILSDLNLSEAPIEKTRKIVENNPELVKVLACPAVGFRDREAVVQKIFPKEMIPFLSVLSRYGDFRDISGILDVYDEMALRDQGILVGTVDYAGEKPAASEIEGRASALFNNAKFKLEYVENPELIGGWRLRVGSYLCDCSVLGSYEALRNRILRR